MGQDASTNQKFENVTSLTEEHFHQGLVLTEDLARHNPQITTITVPQRFLKKTPACLPLFVNLRRLSMPFSSINNNISVIGKTVSLQWLDLSNCDLNSQMIEKLGFENLTNLQTLCLNSNEITELKSISSLKNLATLKLDDNPISSLIGIGELTSLHSLSLNNCYNLHKFPEEIKNLKKLDQLYANTIQFISEEFLELESLRALSLKLSVNNRNPFKLLVNMTPKDSYDFKSFIPNLSSDFIKRQIVSDILSPPFESKYLPKSIQIVNLSNDKLLFMFTKTEEGWHENTWGDIKEEYQFRSSLVYGENGKVYSLPYSFLSVVSPVEKKEINEIIICDFNWIFHYTKIVSWILDDKSRLFISIDIENASYFNEASPFILMTDCPPVKYIYKLGMNDQIALVIDYENQVWSVEHNYSNEILFKKQTHYPLLKKLYIQYPFAIGITPQNEIITGSSLQLENILKKFSFDNIPIESVYMSTFSSKGFFEHSYFAIDENGTPYVHGNNRNCQLGVQEDTSKDWKCIPNLTNISDIIAYPTFTLFISKSGEVYGSGDCNQILSFKTSSPKLLDLSIPIFSFSQKSARN